MTTTAKSARATWTFGNGYPDGRTVHVTRDGAHLGRLYGARGGEWEMTPTGVQGRQLAGTLDARAPMGNGFEAWARRRLAEEARDLGK